MGFVGISSTLFDTHTLLGKTEGLKDGYKGEGEGEGEGWGPLGALSHEPKFK